MTINPAALDAYDLGGLLRGQQVVRIRNRPNTTCRCQPFFAQYFAHEFFELKTQCIAQNCRRLVHVSPKALVFLNFQDCYARAFVTAAHNFDQAGGFKPFESPTSGAALNTKSFKLYAGEFNGHVFGNTAEVP